MAKILAPNKKYCGVSASVSFVDGVGYTEDEDLIKWFDDHGYEVEEIEEIEEDSKDEKPKGRPRKSKPKPDESGDKTEGEPGDESNDSGEDKPE
ncbi:MAG: hypothetical protein E6005_03850 [Peptostreptococcus sp.]|uniref:hypothetical protein n=1 Tax=Peptostreptococcus TaxID=1257 RepID=UPI00232CD120|nr:MULTISPECIES: hypothetical protein [Peptostreptococcus]MDB8821384.1 hypothetical protein [Peptostreptococcus anaerobius]MDB8825970.1 hypothetical protein [Peptostreptococcus anaerobius]MDB8827869.1 hypothetical protein [Peptostreptococcus anaerobius]MDB8829687.1 hypothetical protein [Peptostreptococcus anaerobius]MDB8831549.1 hypothetical protein [Peptostreptococcus anaerobius]